MDPTSIRGKETKQQGAGGRGVNCGAKTIYHNRPILGQSAQVVTLSFSLAITCELSLARM